MMDTSLGDQELRDPALDALLRPVLVCEPAAAVQQQILAAVLLAATQVPGAQRAAFQQSEPQPASPLTPARTISAVTYLVLGAVLLAYFGLVAWIQGAIGGVDWLQVMGRQLFMAADLVFGPSLLTEPFAATSLLVQLAPWMLLLPLAWLLWQRYHAAPEAR
jgi:hypothetical protein